MAWSRVVLFKSAFLSSIVGAVIPLLVVMLTRVEYVALWLGVKAGVQLLVATLPSPVHTLLQSQGGGLSPEEADAIRRRAPLYFAIISLLVFAFVAGMISSSSAIVSETPSLRWSLALFAALAFFSSASLGMLRVLRRAETIYSLAKTELLLSLLILPTLFFGFSAFLVSAAVKEAYKIALLLPAFGQPVLRLPHWRSLLSGRAQYLRGLTQAASQYLERTVYPVIFGLKIAGQLGLGTTLGILPVMLSSNVYLWAFPKLAAGDEQARTAVIHEWAQLLAAAASLCWWLGAGGAVLDLGPYGSADVAMAASFTAFMGIGFLAVARSRAALLSSLASLLHMAVVGLVYIAVAIAAWAGAPVVGCLLTGIAINVAYTLVLAAGLPQAERRMLMSHAAFAFAAVASFAVAAPIEGSTAAAAAFLMAAALSTPRALAFFRIRQ